MLVSSIIQKITNILPVNAAQPNEVTETSAVEEILMQEDFFSGNEWEAFVLPELEIESIPKKDRDKILKILGKTDALNSIYLKIISNLEKMLKANREILFLKDKEIEFLKEQKRELELRSPVPAMPLDPNKISLSHLINHVGDKAKDKRKLSILKKIVDDNIELRRKLKGEI
ncbi:MAG: hypothetical protein HQM10_25645 [Candidatus Riflebacteria bacterium]|nr:hypothetical protein [Candidatus Riflebacteria bacterium]